jgi:hypothetical protein
MPGRSDVMFIYVRFMFCNKITSPCFEVIKSTQQPNTTTQYNKNNMKFNTAIHMIALLPLFTLAQQPTHEKLRVAELDLQSGAALRGTCGNQEQMQRR